MLRVQENRGSLWPIGAALLLHAALVSLAARGDNPLATDSLAYIDVARDIAAGRGFVTHVIPIRFRGEGLAPFVSHPPGYPLLIAPLVLLGVPAGSAASLLSATASLAAFVLFVLLARRVLPSAAPLLAFLYATSYPMAEMATFALSEPLFLATLFAAILIGTGDPARPYPGSPRRAFAVGLLCGALVSVRYAGVVAGTILGALAVPRAFHRDAARPDEARRALLAWGAGSLITILPTLVALLSGGGFPAYATDREPYLSSLLTCAAHTASDVLLPLPQSEPKIWLHVPLGVAGLGLAASLFWKRRLQPGVAATMGPASNAALLALAAYPFLYLAFIAWVRTAVYLNSWPSRHLLPAYPFLFILITVAFRRPTSDRAVVRWRRYARPAIFAFVLLYLIGNVAKVMRDMRDPTPAIEMGDIADWIETHAGPEDAIVATEAEAVAYALPERRVIALVRRPYRVDVLEAGDVDRLRMEQRARWLILLRARSQQVFDGAYGEFVRSLVKPGVAPGLRLAAALPGGLVFEIAR